MQNIDGDKKLFDLKQIAIDKVVNYDYALQRMTKFQNSLELIFEAHISELTPILEKHSLIFTKGITDSGDFVEKLNLVLGKSNLLIKMICENDISIAKGKPLKYSQEDINKILTDINSLNESTKQTYTTPCSHTTSS